MSATLTDQKKKELVLVFMLGISVLAGLYVGFISKYTELASKKEDEHRKLHKVVTEYRSKSKALPALRTKMDLITQSLEEVNSKLIQGDVQLWFTAEMRKFLPNQPIKTEDSGSNTETAEGFGAEVTSLDVKACRLNVQGNFDEIGRFLANLENQYPFAEIRSVSAVAGSDKKGLAVNLKFQIPNAKSN